MLSTRLCLLALSPRTLYLLDPLNQSTSHMYTYTTLSLGEVIYDRYPEALEHRMMEWNGTESEKRRDLQRRVRIGDVR